MTPTPTATVKRGPGGIFYGWWVVLFGSIITTVGSIQQVTATVFFLPLEAELGLTRAKLSFVFSIARLEGGVGGPLVGWMIDRLGPRFPTILGAIMGGTGMLLMSRIDSYLGFAIVYLGVVSIGFSMGFLQVMHAVANIWFVRHRTMAMSIFSATVRFGPAIFTPLVTLVVLRYGWRPGAVFAGVLVLGITLPFAFLIKRSPEAMGLLPDGAQPGEPPIAAGKGTKQQRSNAMPFDFTFKESLRTSAYWLIAFSTLVRLATQSAMSLHMIPIFVWKGYDQQTSANLFALLQLIATPFILALGWLGDRYSKSLILLIGQLLTTLSIFILAYATNIWWLYTYVVLFAFGANTSPVNYSILGEYFGRKVFARLRGALNVSNTLGLVTPVFAGWVYDNTGAYTGALVVFGVFTAISTLSLIFLRAPQRPVRIPAPA